MINIMVKSIFLALFLFCFGYILIGFSGINYTNQAIAAPAPGGGPPGCPPRCPGNPATCDANLLLTETQALQFGSMAAPLAGTVIIDAAGVRTATGGVILLGAGGAAGTFTMSTGLYRCTGVALATITAGPNATLTHASLPATMAVNNFTMNIVAGDAFDPAIPLTVGATLNVGVLQEPGTYTGTYTVTVTFQ